MRLLLDECVTRYLKADFLRAGELEVSTVDEAGFKGLKNGKLLEAAAGAFDCLITVDKSISKQQNLEKLAALRISILLLRATSNRYEDLKALIPRALLALQQIKSGEVVTIEI